MSTVFWEFPAQENWRLIHNASTFKKIYSVLDSLESSGHPAGDFFQELEMRKWLYEIRQRIEDVAISYFFMMFYYEKGIPDKRWYISPGANGESIQYYPDFEEVHRGIKMWFDYFSDTLYYKLFSAWDLVGHFLNVKYDLKIPKRDVYFSIALQKLGNEDKDRNLYKWLNDIKKLPAYEKAHKIRKDITHNYLPHSGGINVKRHGQSITIDLNDYIPSEEIVTNAQEALDLFAQTLQYISQ